MALDFPDSPAIGDEFTGGGFTWVWTGDSWDKVMASVATGGTGFSLLVGSSGNTTYAFDTPQPAGSYSITSQLSDTTFDIYLVTADNANAGYTNTTAVEATAEFDRVVVYGATTDDVLNFEYKPSTAPVTSGDVVDGAAPFITSATPFELPNVDDTTTVSGGNFASDVEIVFIGQDDVSIPAKSIVRSSSTSLIVTRPDDFSSDFSPYTMIATNPGITNPSTEVNQLVDYFTTGIFNIHYLVIAGGGGGGSAAGGNSGGGGGGGAGGYRTSFGTSGGNTSAESTIEILPDESYAVTVGAGAARVTGSTSGVNGSNSVFATVTCLGGGGGARKGLTGLSGGSGGGGGTPSALGGAQQVNQGSVGGKANASLRGGGGGGAGQAGHLATGSVSTPDGAGGNGLQSSITGTAIYRAGGGSADLVYQSLGGGGRGAFQSTSGAEAGAINTGSGGGGGSDNTGSGAPGGAGGSGIVILRYPASKTASVSAGLTSNTITDGLFKVTSFTAGTGTVSFS
jgi:hypothetical protein